jgi:predicted amidohydrolase YtcJ
MGTARDPTEAKGLIDAHGHPLLYGYYSQLPLAGSKSVQEVISRVEQFVSANYSSLPPKAWIEGMGWDQNIWNVKEYPTAVSPSPRRRRLREAADGAG